MFIIRTVYVRHSFPYRSASFLLQNGFRFLATQPSRTNPSKSSTNQTLTPPPKREEEKSWLTQKVEASPLTRKFFLGLTNLLGYGSPRQVAGRRAFAIYEQIAARAPDQDKDFWLQACYLPPTFQSWFTVTNLHIWMLTVRFRALPQTHGRYYEQALIDHFFLDVEDRVRAILQPPDELATPYTFHTSFYINPNNAQHTGVEKKKNRRAPDRVVTRQMKIFKEQWAGMGLAFDLTIVRGDMEMAAAVWRNLLGARGAQGIAYPSTSPSQSLSSSTFHRSVNLVGGEVVNVAKIDIDKEEKLDDGSGVHDFSPDEVDKYLTYPTVMLDVVRYVRKELRRLEAVSDEDVLVGDWKRLRFGKVKAGKSP